jgi:hypothetical protein
MAAHCPAFNMSRSESWRKENGLVKSWDRLSDYDMNMTWILTVLPAIAAGSSGLTKERSLPELAASERLGDKNLSSPGVLLSPIRDPTFPPTD